jgi:hypothetical protein
MTLASFIRVGSLALAAVVIARAPSLAQERSLSLAEMSRLSGSAIVGTVTSVRSAVDETGRLVTYTTFRVEQTMKGAILGELTIKQLGGRANGLSTYIPHMRYFTAGERVIVMLHPASSLGFTSPVGLWQAVWPVDRDGNVTAITSAIRAELEQLARARGVRLSPRSPIGLDVLTSVIGDLVGRPSR